MPHTSRARPKRNQTAQKRLQVTDTDGWTHVTTNNNARRVHRSTVKGAREGADEEDATEITLGPAEAPGRLTLPELQEQYAGHRERWIESETWRGCDDILVQQSEKLKVSGESVERIVCVGLGSPSGFLRDGWVDRRGVSMYQLAALESIKKWFQSNDSFANTIPVYLQDPVFNDLDCALFESLGMTVVKSPEGFELVTRNTLLFCPGAERKHLDLILPSKPGLLFGGPLENTESEIIQAFIGESGSRVLVPFTANEHAFWMTRLYWREQEEV